MGKFWKGLFVAFLVGVGSWATFEIAKKSLEDLLQALGVFNVYLQGAIIVGAIILIVFLVTRKKPLATLRNILDG